MQAKWLSDETLKGNDQISDSKALWWGIAFCVAFTLLIWVIRPLLVQPALLPDQGGTWYYWKLAEPTTITRFTAWGGYFLHQITLWGLIWYAQRNKLRYTNKLHKVNYIALGANAFFCGLHLLQTGIWYDGLAQDTTIASSQGSVILMLVMILLMENQRRGLVFGYGKKLKFTKPAASWMRHYHGYIFAWAAVYTFWYHPMENTSGHLVGFFYMFLILLQGSLFFTRVHVNKYWTFVQEVLVLIHGTMVAVMNGINGTQPPEIWSMFFFGFLALFVVTQMYGLGLSRNMRWAIIAGFIALIFFHYNGEWVRTNEILRIPVIEYLSVFVLVFIYWIAVGIRRVFDTMKGIAVGSS